MEKAKINILCPVCGREIDGLSDHDYIKNNFPHGVLICINDRYAHYIVRGKGHYLARYENKVNFRYNLYLGLN
jgi:hypothetical protein